MNKLIFLTISFLASINSFAAGPVGVGLSDEEKAIITKAWEKQIRADWPGPMTVHSNGIVMAYFEKYNSFEVIGMYATSLEGEQPRYVISGYIDNSDIESIRQGNFKIESHRSVLCYKNKMFMEANEWPCRDWKAN